MITNLENKQGIYIITHIPSGKKYVGKSRQVRFRVRGHFGKSKNPTLLQKDIAKFGIENFKVSVTYFTDVTPKQLVDIEYEAIINEGSMFPNGYNRSCRGHDNVTNREHLRGRKRSLEARTNMQVPHVWSDDGLKNYRKVKRDNCDKHTFVNAATQETFCGSIPEFIERQGFKSSARTALSSRKRHAGWDLVSV